MNFQTCWSSIDPVSLGLICSRNEASAHIELLTLDPQPSENALVASTYLVRLEAISGASYIF